MISSTKLNFLFEQVSFGIVYQNRDGEIQQTNPAAEKLLGLSADQMNGKTSIDPDWRSVRANGEPFPGEDHPAMVALKTGKPVENVVMGVFHPIKKDWVWINIDSFPVFENNEETPIGVYSTFEDISDKHNAENALVLSNLQLLEKTNTLEGLLNSQTNYFVKTDLKGNIIYANEAYTTMFAHAHPNGIIGAKAFEAILPYDHQKTSTAVSKCLSSPGDVVQVELDKPGPDNTIKTSLWEFRSITDKDGRPLEMICIGIDISDYKKAKQELFISEEKYRSLLESMDSFVSEVDLNGTYLTVNNHNFYLQDLKNEEIVGKTIYEFHSREEAQKLIERIKKVCRDKKGDSEDTKRMVNGKEHWYRSNIQPIVKADNSVESVLIMFTDISEQKIAESELRLFQILFENAVNGILVTDLEGHIISCNQFYADLIQINKKEIIGQNIYDQIRANSIPQFKMIQSKLLKNENISSFELDINSRGDLFFPSLVSASIISDEIGNKKYVSYTILDISDRKQIENELIELNINLEKKVKERTKDLETAIQQLETFFDVSLDMLCITDQKGHFLKLSRAFENVLKIKRDDLQGKSCLQFIHPDDMDASIEVIEKLQSQEKVFSFINRYRTAKGDFRYIEWYSSPAGENVYSVARDVTERIARENELIAARKFAEDANKSKSAFLSRMSHELRTPMNSILGFAQILELSELNEMQENSINHILKSGKHLLSLINEVLDIVRIESGKVTLSIEQINIANLVREVAGLLKPLAEKSSVEIILGDSFLHDSFVKADQQKTLQILTNIINNGIKYNRRGGKVFVDLETTTKQSGSKMIRITVRDTGIGIKKEDLQRLFMPFERIGIHDSQIEGSGLGLTVVKELTKLLGGDVGVSSEIDHGSTFWVELPKCDSDKAPETEKLAAQIIETKHSIETATVLYVEDNAMNRTLIQDFLMIKRPNYKLINTEFGKETVDLALKNHPQLILLDLDLPDIHGSEVLKQLKNNTETTNIPVVVVSADATSEQIRNLLSIGAEAYLTKPLDLKEFLVVVDRYIIK